MTDTNKLEQAISLIDESKAGYEALQRQLAVAEEECRMYEQTVNSMTSFLRERGLIDEYLAWTEASEQTIKER